MDFLRVFYLFRSYIVDRHRQMTYNGRNKNPSGSRSSFMERDFNTSQYVVTNMFAARYIPKIYYNHFDDRPRSAFLFFLSGKMTYSFDDRELEVNEGDLLYLPKTCGYSYRVPCKDTEIMQVEFDLAEINNGQVSDVLLTGVPTKVPVSKSEVSTAFYHIIKGYNSRLSGSKMLALSSLYRLLYTFSELNAPSRQDRLADAIAYIEEHKLEHFSMDEAAALCSLSGAQFRRVFKERMGVSPLKYKNSLIVQMATELMKNDFFSVTEIAAILNFEDIYSFSKFFKRETEMSPKQYKEMITR